jgi:hypothetical protein
MSIRSLTNLALVRDGAGRTTAKRIVVNPSDEIVIDSSALVLLIEAADSDADTSGSQVAVDAALNASDAVVTAIPTEPLALYTGLVSAIVALFADDAKVSQQYVPLRWWLFGGGVVLVVSWIAAGYRSQARKRSKTVRSFPVAEMSVAALAFGVWGLVMPESPLRTQLGGTTEAVVTLCITFTGAALVYLAALTGLTKKTKKAR